MESISKPLRTALSSMHQFRPIGGVPSDAIIQQTGSHAGGQVIFGLPTAKIGVPVLC